MMLTILHAQIVRGYLLNLETAVEREGNEMDKGFLCLFEQH